MAINTTTQQCNTSPSLMSPNIKQEKMDKLSPMQQTANVSIAFSITNILSNNFGNNNSKVISEKRNGSAFRSHDDGSPSPKKRKFDRQFEDDDSNGELKCFALYFCYCCPIHSRLVGMKEALEVFFL